MRLGCSWATGDDWNQGSEHHQELTSRLLWRLLSGPVLPEPLSCTGQGNSSLLSTEELLPEEGCGHGLLCRCYLTNPKGGFPWPA